MAIKGTAALAGTKNRLIGKGTMLGLGMQHGLAAFGAMSDYKDAKDQGYSTAGAVAKAGTEFVLGEMLGGWYLPYTLAKGLPSAAVGAAEGISKIQRSMNKTSRQAPFTNAQFRDYNQAFTMRQAGLQMAEASRYNLQQTLMGNEASYLR